MRENSAKVHLGLLAAVTHGEKKASSRARSRRQNYSNYYFSLFAFFTKWKEIGCAKQ
jgi:hypothetical protein